MGGDVEDAEADTGADGIYSTCDRCFGIVANAEGHEAWHRSRGEGEPDAHE